MKAQKRERVRVLVRSRACAYVCACVRLFGCRFRWVSPLFHRLVHRLDFCRIVVVVVVVVRRLTYVIRLSSSVSNSLHSAALLLIELFSSAADFFLSLL